MLISYNWMKELAEFDLSPKELAVALTDLGLETSFLDDRRGWYDGIVCGKVLEVVKHPDADKLSLCKVDIGGETKQIVCGAPNVAAGQAVPVALVGAVLPDGLTIAARKVRGETSEGMICSESELQLSEDHDGIMVLDDDPAPGEKFNERYEVCDVVLEVDLTPNRGDCLSMIGVAREVAAVCGTALKRPEIKIDEDASDETSNHVSVTIDAPDLCPRYAGRMITGLSVKPAPFWMRRRLTALGVRAINNLVDVTNYVLMETGHPLHAFDNRFIAGNKIVVRRAGDGEKFTTLDGKEHKLNNDNMVIADAERAVALAGVMGGENSEVQDDTKDVMLEAAFFNPGSIRRTSSGLNIKTESSFRFERGCDVEGLIYAQDRAAMLMAELGGGSVLKGRVDAYPETIEKRKVAIRYARLNKIMGRSTAPDRVKEILAGLEMNAVEESSESVTIEAPHFRFDIEREIDLVEEIARFEGLNNVESVIPQVSADASPVSPVLEARMSARRHLRSIGMMEGMRVSFVNESDMDNMRLPEDHPYRALVKIDNPLTSEWTHLRSSLLPGLISGCAGAEDANIYEVGVVFTEAGLDAPIERWFVSGVMTETVKTGLWNGKPGKRDFYHIKGAVESLIASLGYGGVRIKPSHHPYYYPKRQADIVIDKVTVGHFGQLHPKTLEAYEIDQELYLFEIDLGRLVDIPADEVMFAKLPKFPSVKRDLAVVAPEGVSAARLEESIRETGGALLRGVALFDVYAGEKIGEGKKSVAFSLEFRDDEKTLTDDEVNAAFDKIVRGLSEELNAVLR